MIVILLRITLLFTVANCISVIKPSRVGNSSQHKETLAILSFVDGYFKNPLSRQSSHSTIYSQMQYTLPCLLEIFREVLSQATEKGILPDFNLAFYYQEGAINNTLTGRLFPEFLEMVREEKETIVSPLFLAPNYGCNKEEGLGWADPVEPLERMSDLLSMPSIHGQACAGFFNPVVFRSKQALTFDIIENRNWCNCEVALVDYFKWKEVAIVGGVDAPGIRISIDMRNALVQRGINVLDVHLAKLEDEDDADGLLNMFNAVKRTRARIIVVAFIIGQMEDRTPNVCLRCSIIYCMSYKAGIRGPGYVLVFMRRYCGECAQQALPQLCDLRIQLQQAQIALHLLKDKYDYDDYQAELTTTATKRFLNISNVARQAGRSGWCNLPRIAKLLEVEVAKYDVAILLAHSLILLDMSQKTLRQRFNSSLAIEKNQTFLSEIITGAADELKMFNTWKGQSSFSGRKCLVEQGVIPYSNEGLQNNGATVNALIDEKLEFIMVVQPKWTTTNNKLPPDLSEVKHYLGVIGNKLAAWTSIAVATVAALLEVVIAVRREKRNNLSSPLHFEERMMLLAGCLILVVASLFFTLGPIFFNYVSFYLRNLLVLVGVALTNSIIVSKTIYFANLVAPYRYSPRHFAKELDDFIERSRFQMRKVVSIALALASFLYVIWIASDPPTTNMRTSDPEIDPVTNKYFDITVEMIESKYLQYWILVFIIVNVIFLWLGFFVVLTLRTNFRVIFSRQTMAIQKAVVHSTLIFFSAVLSSIVVSGTPDTLYICIASWLVFYSIALAYRVLNK